MPSVNDLLRAFVVDLEEGDVPAPLGQAFTLALIWCDLARLAVEVPPADVFAAAADCSPLSIPPLVPTAIRRGSYADHAMQFAPAD